MVTGNKVYIYTFHCHMKCKNLNLEMKTCNIAQVLLTVHCVLNDSHHDLPHHDIMNMIHTNIYDVFVISQLWCTRITSEITMKNAKII